MEEVGVRKEILLRKIKINSILKNFTNCALLLLYELLAIIQLARRYNSFVSLCLYTADKFEFYIIRIRDDKYSRVGMTGFFYRLFAELKQRLTSLDNII